MNALDENRMKINDIDAELVHLFEERMKAVQRILAYKEEHGLPVFDAAREEENIRRTAEMLKDPSMRGYFEDWYRYTMKVSKDYQKDLLEEHNGEEGR